MKKLSYIALVALAALTACSKVEMDSYAPARKVTFQVAAYVPQTKANVSAWGLASFSAKAFLHAEGYADETQNFFGTADDYIETITPYQSNGSAATTDANTAYWGPSHDYYWPKGSTSYINFIAWKGTAPSVPDENTMSWTSYEVNGSSDLLYADKAWRYKANTANGTHYDGDGVTSGVPMLFHHALAQVCFQAQAVNAPTTGNITRTATINSFSLSGVYSNGTLTLTNSDPGSCTTSTWTVSGGNWTPSGNPSSISNSSNVNLSATATDLVSMRTVLPQSVANEMLVSVVYTLVTEIGGSEFSSEIVRIENKKLSELVPDITAWEMGHQITYTLQVDLTANQILISPTIQEIQDWIAAGENSIAIE